MIAKRPEDRFASMREVAGALEAYLAGQATGVVSPAETDTTGAAPSKPERHSGGILIAPWMLWTAIGIVVVGFGITWQLIAMMMRVQPSTGEIAVSQPFKEALSKGEARILVNEEPVKTDDWSKQTVSPIALPDGENKIQVRKGDQSEPPKVIYSDKENPTFLVKTSDGGIGFTTLRRRVADSVISLGGQIRLAGTETWIAKKEALPPATVHLRLDGIDLTAVNSLDAVDFDLIKRLQHSLKLLRLPKGVSRERLSDLNEALPNCNVEVVP
jgi:hypothetical protein